MMIFDEAGVFKLILIIVIPLSIISFNILTTHYLRPGPNEGYAFGQSTQGDVNMHLAITTSIAEQGKFPPDYSIFAGHKLGYPFFADSLSSSFMVFGTSLRWAILIPSFLLLILLFSGFVILAYEILKKKAAVILASIFFFFNGGFGFIYFFNNVFKDNFIFTRIFSEFYQTPTNMTKGYMDAQIEPDQQMRWVNTICDMIIPQRTTMFGWTFVILAFWLLYKAVTENNRKMFITAGIVGGLLPMIHTHSFIAFGLIAFVWMIVYFFQNKDKNHYIENWFYLGIPAAVLAIPQLFIWTFSQASSGQFVKQLTGWIENINNPFFFWFMNIGIVLVLLIPTLIIGRKKVWALYSGAILVFIVAYMVRFQPLSYDNNKLFYIWYLFTCFLSASFCIWLYNRIKKRTKILAVSFVAAVIFLGSFSAVLTFGREIISGYYIEGYSHHSFENYSKNDIETAEWIKKNTLKDGVFLTKPFYIDAVSALAGRSIFCGGSNFLSTHGINYSARENSVKTFYENPADINKNNEKIADISDTPLAENKAEKVAIDYVYVSGSEQGEYKVNTAEMDKLFKMIYNQGGYKIYAVSERAKNFTS